MILAATQGEFFFFSGINGGHYGSLQGRLTPLLACLAGRSDVRGCRKRAAVELAEIQSIFFNGWVCQC